MVAASRPFFPMLSSSRREAILEAGLAAAEAEVARLEAALAERDADDIQRSEDGRTDWDYEQRIERATRAAAFDALQYIGRVIFDPKYGGNLDWVKGNVRGVGHAVERAAGLPIEPQIIVPAWNAPNPYRSSDSPAAAPQPRADSTGAEE